MTGFTPAEFSIGGKMLEVFKELTPGTIALGQFLMRGRLIKRACGAPRKRLRR